MTQHPGYPVGYLDLFKCRETGTCWWCQKRPALKREFVNKPCCAKCKRELTVVMT